MNLINRQIRLFCVSNIMISFVCGSFIGNNYNNLIEQEEMQNELAASSDVDPLSHLGDGISKTIKEVIDVPNVEEIGTVSKTTKTTKTSTKKTTKKTTTTNVVTKKAVKASTTYAPAKYSEVTGSAVVEYAKKYLGLRYNSGLSLKTGTDCSGFTKLIYREFGITLSRTASGQAKSGTYVRKGDLQKGDLVFYSNGSGRITHVAIYIGGGRVIHQSNPRDGVKYSSVNMMQYITARRVINNTAKKIAEQKLNSENETVEVKNEETNTTTTANNDNNLPSNSVIENNTTTNTNTVNTNPSNSKDTLLNENKDTPNSTESKTEVVKEEKELNETTNNKVETTKVEEKPKEEVIENKNTETKQEVKEEINAS